MDILLGLLIGAVFFISTITAYILGLKHGKEASKGQIPLPPITQAIQTAKSKPEVKAESDELSEILGYSAESALRAIKAGDGR